MNGILEIKQKLGMNKDLKSAVHNYEQEPIKGINPVSEIDAEIIVEISEAVRKLGNDDLKRIIQEWKNLKDEEVLAMMIDWNLNNEEGVKKDDKFRKNFILFDDLTLDIYFVVSISKKRMFNAETGDFSYLILINENTNEKSLYHDTRVSYSSEKERDERYNKLHEILMDTDTINFY